jgi:hypothetical protein
MAASINNPAWLEWMNGLMGGVSRQTQTATFPPDRFYCLLDELPVHLLTRRAFRSMQKRNCESRELFLNPDCEIRAAEDLPEELADCGDLLSGFALQGTIAWVRDSLSKSLLPFWLGPKLQAVLREIRPDEPVPSSVLAKERSLLAAAGILIAKGHSAQREREHEEMVRKAGALFRERGYAPLSNLIHPFHVAALRRYYRHRIRTGSIQLGDGQTPRRYCAYNEPVARFFHRQILGSLSAVAGELLKPSYVYMASYLSEAVLEKHTDRAQCEFSVTLCLDFSPEPALATPWPIKLDTAKGTVAVHQALGDGLAYRGTRLPHYRSALGEGQTSTSIFFHYVAADFDGPLG